MAQSSADQLTNTNLIVPRLYLGPLVSTQSKESLEAVGITHILSLGVPPLTSPDTLVGSKYIDIPDERDVDLKFHFREAISFIKEALARDECKVLVHCVAGASRSASCVIAYIMESQKLTFREAYDLVEEKRPVIYPNESFCEQLRLFERELLQAP